MATFRPYDGEGYGGLDTYESTTLNGMDLKGRLPGDVLQEILYAGPEGEIHPALGVGCHPSKIFSYDAEEGGKVRILPINTPMKTVDEAKARQLRTQFVLGADSKAVAKMDQNAHNAKLFAQGSPVTDDYAVRHVPQVAQGGVVRYPGARSIVPYRTPCECKALIQRAELKFGRNPSAEHLVQYLRDFHGQDQRYFNDSDIIIQEFYGMPNATSLAIMLTKAGVIDSPPFPLRVCKGRDKPCACSVVGPELVNRIYYFLVDDWEHDSIFQKDPIGHNIGNLLARYNERVTIYFSADDYNRRLKQSQEQRVIDMARLMGDRKGSGNPGAAGTWNFDPFPAREPGKGRVTHLVGELGGVPENKRLLSEKIAKRYGFKLMPDGRLIDETLPEAYTL